MSDYTVLVRTSLLILAANLFSATLAAQVAPSMPPTADAPALNKISDVGLSDNLLTKLKAKISASPDVSHGGKQSSYDFDLDAFYNILVKFSANRETYTNALSHYADVFREHGGITGIVYRDQAYSQLVQSADDLLGSLQTLRDYLRYSGVALQSDTASITAILQQFTDAKGAELHSVVDSLRLTGLTSDQLQALSARAVHNGASLQSQIAILQQMLIAKGASLRSSTMPQYQNPHK